MKKFLLILLALVLVIVLAANIVMSLPQFGGKIQGERLKRVEANPHYEDGAFVNVERQAPFTMDDILGWFPKQFFGDEVHTKPGGIPVIPVHPASLDSIQGLRAFWIGHSSVYVEIDGIRLLIDPVFSEYASPFNIGPQRFHSPPIALASLPKIDAVVISHDHYDHLDMETVKHLSSRGTNFYVPLGIGTHLERWEVPAAQIRELEWWQEESLNGVRIVCTPTRHYSGRGLTNFNSTLWSSWSVIGPNNRIYYSGDTGYSKHFAEVGEKFGPFDIAFIKIGAYGPGQSWLDIHMEPESSVKACRDVGGHILFPLHWATFDMAHHNWDEPIKRTLTAAAMESIKVVTPRIGEIFHTGRDFISSDWWTQQ